MEIGLNQSETNKSVEVAAVDEESKFMSEEADGEDAESGEVEAMEEDISSLKAEAAWVEHIWVRGCC